MGGAGRITAVAGDAAIAQRLGDLGFVPGTAVRVRGRAPLGDPRIYELRGTRFCLRRREAAAIHVAPQDAGATP